MPQLDVAIVGAGLSGLSAAIHLQNEGLNIKVFESSDDVGGRARTDIVDGFLLDRGFQVLLTAYPEAQQMLNYEALDLKRFEPGALIQHQGKSYHFQDPFRKPSGFFKTLVNPLANLGDKLKILALRNRHKRLTVNDIFQKEESSTLDFLREWNFSERMIEHFFKPFLGGVFLDNSLLTSSRMFEFVFKMFSEGYAALPAKGMGELAKQLAAKLSKDTVQLNSAVKKVQGKSIILWDDTVIECGAILLATNPIVANQIADLELEAEMHSSITMYFSADLPPYKSGLLMLNGDENRLVNHVCIPSNVQSTYAPEGRALISVTVLDDMGLEPDTLLLEVKKSLRSWFKKELKFWEHLATYRIEQALPVKTTISIPARNELKAVREFLYLCGDHMQYGSINAALNSGRVTADMISWDLATRQSD